MNGATGVLAGYMRPLWGGGGGAPVAIASEKETRDESRCVTLLHAG